MNKSDDTITTDVACRWDVSINRECEGTIYFLWIHYIAAVMSSLVTIFALGLLIYKRLCKNSPLWNEQMFEPIIGFLIWISLYGTFTSVYMLIIIHDWIYSWFIFKAVVTSFGWLFSIFATATYLVGIFKTLPKLAFHQRTCNSHCENQTSRKFIPSNKSIALIYWTFVIIMGSLALILSCLRGYYQGIGDLYLYNVFRTTLLALYGLAQLIGIFLFIKYGRLLVNLLNETIQLLGANDSINNPSTFRKLSQYQANIMKLKFINLTLMMVLCWFASLNILLAILRNPLGTSVAFSVVIAAISLIGSAMMKIASLCVIFHGDIYRRYSSKVMDSSIQLSEISYNSSQDH